MYIQYKRVLVSDTPCRYFLSANEVVSAFPDVYSVKPRHAHHTSVAFDCVVKFDGREEIF